MSANNSVRPMSIEHDLRPTSATDREGRALIRRPSNSESNLNARVRAECSAPEATKPLLSGAHSLPNTDDSSDLIVLDIDGDHQTSTATAPRPVVIPLTRGDDPAKRGPGAKIRRSRISTQSTSTANYECISSSQNVVAPTNENGDADALANQHGPPESGARSTEPEASHAPSGCDPNVFLRLCVGCKTFVLRKSHLQERAPESFLAEFSELKHEQRLRRCHGFFADTSEYLFERSPKLFEAVYKYYITGHLHRPMDCCMTEFVDELQFWSLPGKYIQSCCMPSIMESNLKNEEKTDPFIGLCAANVRRKMWAITEGDGSMKSKLFSVFSIGLVMVSVTALVVSSVREFQVEVPDPVEPELTTWEPLPQFYYLESACIAWFTFELVVSIFTLSWHSATKDWLAHLLLGSVAWYLLRLVIAPHKLTFMVEVLNVVDFLAVMPFYLELTLQLCGVDSEDLKNFKFALVMVRLLRSLRVMRILKVSRYSEGMRIFALTIKSSASQLAMIVMVFSIGVIFFATLVYFMEKDEPDSPFTSIPVGFWWCIVTMTTVGYGDIVPLTTIGKIVGTAAIVSGVLVLALPITIMVDNFMKVAGK